MNGAVPAAVPAAVPGGTAAGEQRALVRFQKPQIPALAEIAVHYARSEEARWFSNSGPCVQELERGCAGYLGLDLPGVAVSNATLGIMVALRACMGAPSRRRRYIAVPSFTFIATVNAIAWAGFEPLFVDIDPESWQPSSDSLEQLAARRDSLAGVLLCSTFGTAPSASLRAVWRDFSQSTGLPTVVDSAAGFGAVDECDHHLGDQGVAEVFSFHATKPFAIGEGGLVTSTSEEVLAAVRRLTNFGFDSARGVPGELGLNAKMSELHGATGLAVLSGFENVLKGRRQAARALIDGVEPFGVIAQEGHSGSTFQFVPVAMPSREARQRLLDRAPDAGVEVRVYFDPPMHRLSQFKGAPRAGDLGVTEWLSDHIVALPMANDLDDAQIERIMGLVKGCV
jgi:dTDP-4-amino-4,6-dideoxygalactose transaminase